MSKILFIYPNIEKSIQENMAIEALSANLQLNGFSDILLWDNTFDSKKELTRLVKEFSPTHICYTALSPDFEYAKEINNAIKEYHTATTIIGGPHVTFLPFEGIEHFDVVFRGEADNSLVQYIKTSDNKTKGAWIKDGNTIYMNELDDLPDVRKLPWPDHDLFNLHMDKKITWSKLPINTYGTFMTARGCPFKCTYCYSKGMQDLYCGQKYNRHRNIHNVIMEIKYFSDRYNMDALYIIDETLTTNKKRIIDFCKEYKEVVNIPWHCETRPNAVNEEVLSAMKDAKCETVMMGIESGSDRIRNGLYKRNLSEEQIIFAFKTAKKVGIQTSAFNICGAPTETIEEMRETIDLNKRCSVDMGKMTIFNAFPGSELWDYCNNNGYYIRKQYPKNYYIDSNFQHDTLSIKQLIDLRKEYVDSIGGYSGSKNKEEV